MTAMFGRCSKLIFSSGDNVLPVLPFGEMIRKLWIFGKSFKEY